MRQPGYDTFGPQYPPEWDKPDTIECDVCGQEFDEDEAIGQTCPECIEKLNGGNYDPERT